MNPSLRLISLFALGALSACSVSFDPFPVVDAGSVDASTDAATLCPPLRCQDGFEVQRYFSDSCGTSACHGADVANPNFDYISGDVFARLVGLRPNFSDIACVSSPVIDPVNASNSMLIRKLRASQGACGDRMPFDALATEPQVGCIISWIEREACLRTGMDAGPLDAGNDAGSDAGNDAGSDPCGTDLATFACEPGIEVCHSEINGFRTERCSPVEHVCGDEPLRCDCVVLSLAESCREIGTEALVLDFVGP